MLVALFFALQPERASEKATNSETFANPLKSGLGVLNVFTLFFGIAHFKLTLRLRERLFSLISNMPSMAPPVIQCHDFHNNLEVIKLI